MREEDAEDGMNEVARRHERSSFFLPLYFFAWRSEWISCSVICAADVVSMKYPSETVTVSVEMMTEALSLLIVMASLVRVIDDDDDEAPFTVKDCVSSASIRSVLYMPACSSMVSVMVVSI